MRTPPAHEPVRPGHPEQPGHPEDGRLVPRARAPLLHPHLRLAHGGRRRRPAWRAPADGPPAPRDRAPLALRADRVADADAAGLHDLAVDAERQRLGVAVAPVAGERAEGVEVRGPGVGIALRDDAAADVSQRPHHGGADPHRVADPAVLLVRADAVDLEQHAEAAAVDGLLADLVAQALERGTRDDRHPAAAIRAAIDRAALGPEQRQGEAGETDERVLPRADHPPRGMWLAVE